jgi:hypothetical protein
MSEPERFRRATLARIAIDLEKSAAARVADDGSHFAEAARAVRALLAEKTRCDRCGYPLSPCHQGAPADPLVTPSMVVHCGRCGEPSTTPGKCLACGYDWPATPPPPERHAFVKSYRTEMLGCVFGTSAGRQCGQPDGPPFHDLTKEGVGAPVAPALAGVINPTAPTPTEVAPALGIKCVDPTCAAGTTEPRIGPPHYHAEVAPEPRPDDRCGQCDVRRDYHVGTAHDHVFVEPGPRR